MVIFEKNSEINFKNKHFGLEYPLKVLNYINIYIYLGKIIFITHNTSNCNLFIVIYFYLTNLRIYFPLFKIFILLYLEKFNIFISLSLSFYQFHLIIIKLIYVHNGFFHVKQYLHHWQSNRIRIRNHKNVSLIYYCLPTKWKRFDVVIW